MKKILLSIGLTLGFVTLLSAQTDLNGLTAKLSYGNEKTSPVTYVTDSLGNVIDTLRLGESNFVGLQFSAFTPSGFGGEIAYKISNSYFDTLAGESKTLTVGMAFQKAGYAPGALYNSGFNCKTGLGVGFFSKKRTDQVTYLITDSSGASSRQLWGKETLRKGFYGKFNVELYRDNPYDSRNLFLYSISLKGDFKYPLKTALIQKRNENPENVTFFEGDSANLFNWTLEIKPINIPVSSKCGISLLTGAERGNFTSFDKHSPRTTYKLGLSLDSYLAAGEVARISYVGSSDLFKSNGIFLELDAIQLYKIFFD